MSTTPNNTWLTSGGRLVDSNAAMGCLITIQNESDIIEGCVTKDTTRTYQVTSAGPEGNGVCRADHDHAEPEQPDLHRSLPADEGQRRCHHHRRQGL